MVKVCSLCGQQKDSSCFSVDRRKSSGYRSSCRECNKVRYKEYHFKNKDAIKVKKKQYYNDRPERVLLESAIHRAKLKKLECNITVDDIVIPDICPILGIKLFKGHGKKCDNSPTLDRIDNDKGYIKGNVIVVSNRANTIKSYGTYEEHIKVAEFLKSKLKA
jgi:hypothetical protein